MICLRDPEGYVEEHAVLSPQAFFIAACLDGQNDIVDIQHAFARQFKGALLMSDDILRVVNYLETHGFLHSERFAAIRGDLEGRFARMPARPAWCAGKSYSDNAADLRQYLDQLLRESAVEETAGTTACLIVPHIDFGRGGPAYGKGYGLLRNEDAPETAIIFGVAHNGGDTPFILTRKDFETPLGLVRTDRELVDRLASACKQWNPFSCEILHRTEHSIEFQALLLAHLFGGGVQIVPILCGSMFEMHDDGVRPSETAMEFLVECRQTVADGGRKTIVVAGADLAHVGRRFGDHFDITAEVTKTVEQRDRQGLDFVCAGNAAAFHESIMEDNNARRVCGHGCIYAALTSVEGSVGPGEVFHYGYAPDPAGGMVSFAAVRLPYA